MSVRMLQRALRSQELHQPPPPTIDVEEEEDSGDDAHNITGAASNSFGLLEIPDEADEVEERDSSGDNSKSGEASGYLPARLKKPKKKKKKGGKKVISSAQQTEDVDQLLKKFCLSEGSSSTSKAPTKAGSKWLSGVKAVEVLTVDTKHLKAEDELKRIFGSKVINAVERGNGNMIGGLRRRQGGAMRKLGRANYFRKTTLVSAKEYWPSWDGSLSMEHTGVKDGLQYFKYTYSSSYMETQRKYEASGASYDPNTIAMLLAHHPYHLESLLALAEVYKQLGEYQQSVECLERCLFALECAWHPLFNPYNGTCRLPFSCDTNKNFFSALSKHMQHLGRRGCHRSALEVCKLLLSLDADDPLGALFSIDYFALRAEQFQWLEEFADCYSNDSSLGLLPNFSFSLAVARFNLESKKGSQSSTLQSSEELVKVEGAAVPSEALLRQALMLHPATLSKIVDKAPIKQDAEWGRILRHPHFKKATPGGPSLEHLVNLYVERNYLIWRVPELQIWLKAAASAVIETADKDSGEVANWACVRQEAFPSENNEYRHLHFSEFSDSAPAIPPEELQQMMFNGDGENMNRPNVLVEDENGQGRAVALEGRNALLVFLQSLLPWTDYGLEQQLVAAAEGSDADEEQ